VSYRLRLPGREPVEVPSWGNLAIELVAERAGVKPAVQAWIDESDRPVIARLARELDLATLEHARNGERIGVMLGKRPGDLELAAGEWAKPDSNPGVALGYPDCCSTAYKLWHHSNQHDASYPDIVFTVAEKTTGLRGLPAALNDLFYFFSRNRSPDAEPRRRRLEQLNAGLDLNGLNLIGWHPCSYRCKNSLAVAAKIRAALETLLPELAAVQRLCLSRPVLFWDWDRFAALKGAWRGEDFFYEKVAPPFGALDAKTSDILRRGDRIKASEKTVEVLKGDESLAVYGRGALFLDFQ